MGALRQAIRRMRFGEPIIVVSGLPRSGTSMLMQMLEAGGVEILTDGLRAADVSNPQGYYELERVKELDKPGDTSWLAGGRGKAVKIIAFLLRYLPETFNYKVIFMHRDLHEVIASQNKMLRRRGEPARADDDRMLELFGEHLGKIQSYVAHRAGFDVLDVPYHRALTDPAGEASRIGAFLGADLNAEAMAEVVNPELYRNRRGEESDAAQTLGTPAKREA